jgi:surfactin synthase thioesterase subunit
MAYETAELLLADGRELPQHLVVSGAASPWSPLPPTGISRTACDDELVEQLARIVGGTPPGFDHPRLRVPLLRMLRADIAILDTHRPGRRPLLPLPVTSLRGATDQVVTACETARWGEVTSYGHRHIDLPGHHMYLTEDWALLWSTLETALTKNSPMPDGQRMSAGIFAETHSPATPTPPESTLDPLS